MSCGNGKRKRTVECSGGRGKCDARSEPQATTSCNLGSCPEWQVGDWSKVKSFGTKNASVILDPLRSYFITGGDSSSRRKWPKQVFYYQVSIKAIIKSWLFRANSSVLRFVSFVLHLSGLLTRCYECTLFLSVLLPVEMDQENAKLNAVDQTSAATLIANHKLHRGVTSARVPYGKLGSGIR